MGLRRKSFNSKNVNQSTLVDMVAEVRSIAAASPNFVYTTHIPQFNRPQRPTTVGGSTS